MKKGLHIFTRCCSNHATIVREEYFMARVCEICGKRPVVGNNVSHANNKTKRVWRPNLQKIRALDDKNGAVRRIKICTRCLRSGFVRKAV